MGYYYYHRDSKVTVTPENIEVIELLLEDMTPRLYGSWYIEKDESGNITGLVHSESKSYDLEFLEAIAEFVEDGSFVEMRNGDDEIFRLVFEDGKVVKKKATISFE